MSEYFFQALTREKDFAMDISSEIFQIFKDKPSKTILVNYFHKLIRFRCLRGV